MTSVDDEAIPRDDFGHLIMNAAGSVSKTKVKDGKEYEVQRFISNLIPINDFLLQLPGDQDQQPYVAQLSLIITPRRGRPAAGGE